MQGAGRRGTRSRDPRITPWAEGGAKPLSPPDALCSAVNPGLVRGPDGGGRSPSLPSSSRWFSIGLNWCRLPSLALDGVAHPSPQRARLRPSSRGGVGGLSLSGPLGALLPALCRPQTG
ncbi:hypothetical protein VULLAG_LOCUS23851 [Vulpes lagopus]